MQIRMLADTHSELTTALDLEMDTSAILGNNRMKRCVLCVMKLPQYQASCIRWPSSQRLLADAS